MDMEKGVINLGKHTRVYTYIEYRYRVALL